MWIRRARVRAMLGSSSSNQVSRVRAKAWRPSSIVNVSAMSYGALGAHAIEALNRGAIQAGCYHNTGEGGISRFHKFGADLV